MKYVLLLFVFGSFSLYAQDAAPAFKKHSLGINHSYDITSQIPNDTY